MVITVDQKALIEQIYAVKKTVKRTCGNRCECDSSCPHFCELEMNHAGGCRSNGNTIYRKGSW
jgi:hypothetical protein